MNYKNTSQKQYSLFGDILKKFRINHPKICVIIFFIALEMIMGISIYKNDVPETASIIPIAFPIIAGPGSLTTLLSLRAEFELVNIILAVLFNIAIVFLILKSTNIMSKILGKSGIAIIQKVFGIILLSIAVKLFATNVGQIIN